MTFNTQCLQQVPNYLCGLSATTFSSSPFKGEVRWGMSLVATESQPIPTPALPLKGRERFFGAQADFVLPMPHRNSR